MRAQFVNESYNFERGRDPKRSMGIGLVGGARGVKDFWTYRNRQDVLLDEDESIEAISPHISERQALNTVVEFDDNSMLRLEYPMEEQTPLLYRGNYYEYKLGPGRRRGYVKVDLKESYNFERGKDPKDAMGIGITALPYPEMSPGVFGKWFEKEILPYIDGDDWNAMFDNLFNNDWESDDEIYGFLIVRRMEPGLAKELVSMRKYFADEEYLDEVRRIWRGEP